MSEEKRKSARTQGRFSCDKEAPRSGREKEKQKYKSSHSESKFSKGGEKAKNGSHVSRAAEGVSLQYQENSNYSFKDLEKKRDPEELRFEGPRQLSTTANGVSSIIYDSKFLCEEADELMDILSSTTTWHEKEIVIRGEKYPQPRLVAWYGPFPYSYSGATLEAAGMPSTVDMIRQRVEHFLGQNGIDVNLNSVLLNKYRNEKDSVSWHSDDELTMGVCPTIASVSLGTIRKFEMRPKLHTVEQNETLAEDYVCYVNLQPGSLIIMDGCMQKDWQHRVPKEYHSKPPRINLTFRTVYAINQLPPEVPSSRSGNLIQTSASKNVPEPKFDTESFPPLMQTNQKSKPLNRNKVSSDSVSSTQLNIPGSPQINTMEYVVDENENQNNLNKDLDCCTLEDSSHYNLMEPEKSSDERSSVSNELVNEVSEKSYPDSNFPAKKVCHANGVQQFEVDNENNMKAESQVANKYKLNVDAPDFVPHFPATLPPEPVYVRYSLVEMAQHYADHEREMSHGEIAEFSRVLFEKIDLTRKPPYFFLNRDWHELDTLHKLSKGGQQEANERVILERICSMIKHADRDYRSPQRRPYVNRTIYSGETYRSRNSYRTRY